jgi:hypothetical protein
VIWLEFILDCLSASTGQGNKRLIQYAQTVIRDVVAYVVLLSAVYLLTSGEVMAKTFFDPTHFAGKIGERIQNFQNGDC